MFLSIRIRYCYTARGGFCYSEGNLFDFHAGKEFFAFPFHYTSNVLWLWHQKDKQKRDYIQINGEGFLVHNMSVNVAEIRLFKGAN
jgi:hypothetical protein